jgi:hypothetical protein
MYNLLQYQDNNYFNNTDYFLIYDNLNNFYTTKVHLYNGNWYANSKLSYKMTSVKSFNCNYLL